MYAPGRTTFLATSLISLLLTSVAPAANIDWDDGGLNKNWSNVFNWNPTGTPAGDDLEIGNLATAQGDMTIIDQDFAINSLAITDAADADTWGNVLTVNGLLTIGEIGSSFVASEHTNGPGFTVLNVEDMIIFNSAAFLPRGGTVVVAEPGGGANFGRININPGSFLSGYGIVRFDDALSGVGTTQLVNDGNLQTRRLIGSPATQRFNLRIESTDANARIDLDGITNTGDVQIDENTTLDLALPTEIFHSSMNLEAGSILQLSERLETDGGAIHINAGFGTPGVPSTATIRGHRIGGSNLQTNAAQFNINSGSLVHEEGINLSAPSSVNLALNTKLVINNMNNTGASLSSIFGQINFNGAGAELVIGSAVSLATPSWNWDGPEDATTTITRAFHD